MFFLQENQGVTAAKVDIIQFYQTQSRGAGGRGELFREMLEMVRQVRAVPSFFGGQNLLCCEIFGLGQVIQEVTML